MRQAVEQRVREAWPVAGASPDRGAPVDGRWARICARLEDELGASTFRSWFGPLSLLGIYRDGVRLSVPTRFIRDWILSHYEDRLRAICADEIRGVDRVELILADDDQTESATPGTIPEIDPVNGEAAPSWAPRPSKGGASAPTAKVPMLTPAPTPHANAAARYDAEADGLSARLDPLATFDRFVVGSANRLAFVAARQVASGATVRFNPLYIFGGVGLGKTHLLQAVAWEIRRRDPKRRAVYMSAEHFMYKFIRALRDRDMLTFKDRLRGVDVLLLDDLRFIANKESTQEEFLHTFNALMEQDRQMVVAADCAPSQLEGVDDRIRSRLGQGLAADIRPMDLELRLDILVSKAEHVRRVTGSRLDVPHVVIRFLAENIVTNVRVLEGALNRLVAHAHLVDKPITLDMAKERLADILRSGEPRLSIDQIQRCVATHFHVGQSDMLSRRRTRDIVRPRQVAMYLCKQLTTRSLPEIGRKFGGRDHTTVIHAVRRVEELRRADPSLDRDIEALTSRLSS